MRVCVTLHIHVEMDGGDVMSGIDPLNMAPSHHNDDVIHRFTDGGGIVAAIEILGVLETFNDANITGGFKHDQ